MTILLWAASITAGFLAWVVGMAAVAGYVLDDDGKAVTSRQGLTILLWPLALLLLLLWPVRVVGRTFLWLLDRAESVGVRVRARRNRTVARVVTKDRT